MHKKDSFFKTNDHTKIQKVLSVLVITSFIFTQAIPTGFSNVYLYSEEYTPSHVPETPVDQEQPIVSTQAPVSDTTGSFISRGPLSVGSNFSELMGSSDVVAEPSFGDGEDATRQTAMDAMALALQNVTHDLNDSDTADVTDDEVDFTTDETVDPVVARPGNDIFVSSEVDEYTFENAIAQFSPDYAAAVVVESLTAENLRDLVNLDVEVGIAVIRGKIVLFTTGSRDEIRANPVVREILADESSVLMHVHPRGEQVVPSALDIDLAASAMEYLVTADGVFAYNASGIQNDQLTEEDLVELIDVVRVADASSVEARSILNEFILNIDEFNAHPEAYTILRSAQPISVLPGKPTLGAWNSGAPLPTITQGSTSEFSINYNISNAGSYVGATVNLASGGRGSQNLSGLGYFSFDVRSSVACSAANGKHCMKVEFKDAKGRVGAFVLKELGTTYVNRAVDISWIQGLNRDLDMTQIKEINFIFENSWGAPKVAKIDIKLGGLYFEPQVSPGGAVAPTDFGSLNLSPSVAEMEPATHNTVTLFNQLSSSQYVFNYNLTNGTSSDYSRWAGSLISFANGAFDLEASDLVLGVSATGTSQLKLELISGSGSDEKRVVLILKNLTGNTQFYRITEAIVKSAGQTGLDLTAIRRVAIVIDDPDATTGKVTVTTKNLFYQPVITATTTSALTILPVGSSIIDMEPKGYNTVTGFTQTSSSVASFTYDLANGTGDNRWAGALISLGSGFNLAANDLVISGSDAGSSYYKVVLEDAEGDKVTVRVNVDGRVSLTQSMVDSVGNASFNATDVRYVSIVVDDPSATTGTLEITTGGLAVCSVIDNRQQRRAR